MCGLPASGKTTTAGRLHAHAGGVLIRSCDVYAGLRIRLPDWVERTRGFTVNVHEYDQVRDRAYEEIARRLERSIDRAGLVILDAVYGERAKRGAIHAICRSRGADVVLLHCRCDDPNEVARRFDRRRGHESVPEHEASDRSVFRDIARRWEDPRADQFAGGGPPTIITVDTLHEPPIVSGSEASWLPSLLRQALATTHARAMRS
ncbi:MAG: AAA family ATPase [Candidatus Rokuibacteriota bacterium]